MCFDFIRKCLSYQALSAFVRLRRVSETGSLSTIPNFIYTHSPSIFPDLQGLGVRCLSAAPGSGFMNASRKAPVFMRRQKSRLTFVSEQKNPCNTAIVSQGFRKHNKELTVG